jgi:VWFA-related protein
VHFSGKYGNIAIICDRLLESSSRMSNKYARILPRCLPFALCSLAILAARILIVPDAESQNQPSRQAQPQTARPNAVVQSETHLVTIDVVATDSHGAVIRSLKADEFEINDGGRQQIAKFSFIDKSSTAPGASSAPPSQPGVYTNEAAIDSLTIPPTVILLDSLNTDANDMLSTRRDMLELLKSLPANTPVAVFLLGQSLEVVQNFSSDPARLRAAVDKAMSARASEQVRPQDNEHGLSLVYFDNNGGQESDQSKALEDFEMRTYSNQMDIRVDTTMDALTGIAHFLSAYRGRKNLIWVSESFPIALFPDANYGSGQGAYMDAQRTYYVQAQRVGDALSDAHVAVYPVDANGLNALKFFDASSRPVIRANSPSRSVNAVISRETNARDLSELTVDGIADETGGQSCHNSNDLSICVADALKQSSSYYELSYSPQNLKWDGSFRNISLKTSRSGVHLSYRRGYYASDAEATGSQQPPEKRLQQACTSLLPSTEIPISAVDAPQVHPNEARFAMTIPPGSMAIVPAGQSYKVSALMATCIFAPDGHESEMSVSDLSATLNQAQFQKVQTAGLQGYIVAPEGGTVRVRIALLDQQTGAIGSLDLPIKRSSSDTAAASTPAAAATAAAAEQSTKTRKILAPLDPSTSIAFNSPSGVASALDWGSGKLVYEGDLSTVDSAQAFFTQFFANGLHCQAGALVWNNPNARHAPALSLTFKDNSGQSISVNLKGDQPAYSGTLPADDSAKSFFESLWPLVHCK